MKLARNCAGNKFLHRRFHSPPPAAAGIAWLCLGGLLCGSQAFGQSQPPTEQTDPQPQPQSSGSISGTVVDGSGAAVAGAHVNISRGTQSPNQEVLTGDDGQFSFASVAPGPYQLSVTSAGFAAQKISGTVHAGEAVVVPQITLAVATANSEVQVVVPRTEVAEEQIKEQEKQRVLGFIPNFYVSYDPHAVPLTSNQKFELAWRTTVDPITFGMIGVVAGIQQSQNDFSGYGQGAAGYGKRYGAAYADFVTGTFIGSYILPSLLKQDPRYFYKGSGSAHSRFFYAVANAVICKGDNGRWQTNYSNIFGTLASGGISNLYYPAKDRGVGITFENALIGIGATAAANVIQEFLVRKLTPNLPNHDRSKP